MILFKNTGRFSTRSHLQLLLVLAYITCASTVVAWDKCAVITTDYSTLGNVRSMARTSSWTVSADLYTTNGDAVGRHHGGLYYIVARGGASNLTILDPADNYSVVRQFSLGVGRNPQDIAFDSQGQAYISCYDAALLLRVNVETGTILEEISTSQFADTDGLPETTWMLAVDDMLYINCQRLDINNYYTPTGSSYLLAFNMATRTWVDANPDTSATDGILLTGENPYTHLSYDETNHVIRVGCCGYFGILDGGIEQVDLASMSSWGFEMSEVDLGGDILDLISVGENIRWVIISDSSFRTAIKRYDLDLLEITLVEQASGYDHSDIVFDGDFQVFSADRTLGNSGIKVFDATSGAKLSSSPISTGLPPFMIVLPEDNTTAVPVAAAKTLNLASPWPNPSNPISNISFTALPNQNVCLNIYDLRGRRVVSTVVRTSADGSGSYVFRGQDETGRSVAAGVYRVVVETPGDFAARSLTIIK